MKRIIFLIIIIVAILIAFLVYEDAKMPKEFQITQFNTNKDEVLVGVISDTHIPTKAEFIPSKVKEIFENVDLIIHAGDIESLEVIKELEKIAPVVAVYGNTDPPETKENLSPAVYIEIHDWRIGVIHNSIVPWMGWKMERIAKKNNLNVLIFGHTHRSFLKENKILVINPGSPTNPIFARPSVALLKIDENSSKGEIKYLD